METVWMDKSCLTKLITFYSKMAGLVVKEKGISATHFDFTKAFCTISQNVSRLIKDYK